jgi:hypothetical protein
MNILTTDENVNLQQAYLNLISDSKRYTEPTDSEGNVNLFQNELLTLWILYGDQYLSSARLGNFIRDVNGKLSKECLEQIFGDKKKTISNKQKLSNQELYPALLFYKKTLDDLYPVLDIGIQPNGSGSEAVIAFKKKQTGDLVEYAQISFDEQGQLNFDNRGSKSTIASSDNEFKNSREIVVNGTNPNPNEYEVETKVDYFVDVPQSAFAKSNKKFKTGMTTGYTTTKQKVIIDEASNSLNFVNIFRGSKASGNTPLFNNWSVEKDTNKSPSNYVTNVKVATVSTDNSEENTIYQKNISSDSVNKGVSSVSNNTIYMTVKSNFTGNEKNTVDTNAIAVADSSQTTIVPNTTVTVRPPSTTSEPGQLFLNLPEPGGGVSYFMGIDNANKCYKVTLADLLQPLYDKIDTLTAEINLLKNNLNK